MVNHLARCPQEIGFLSVTIKGVCVWSPDGNKLIFWILMIGMQVALVRITKWEGNGTVQSE